MTFKSRSGISMPVIFESSHTMFQPTKLRTWAFFTLLFLWPAATFGHSTSDSSFCLFPQVGEHPIRMVDNQRQKCEAQYILESSKSSPLAPIEIELSALDDQAIRPFDGGVISIENGSDTLTKASKEIWDGVACLANLQIKPKIQTVSSYETIEAEFNTDVFVNVISTCCNEDRTSRFRLIFPFFPRKFFLLFEQPELSSDVFKHQFSPILWKAFGLFLILITVVIALANWLKDKDKDAREAAFLTLNMLTQTGADQEPQDGPRRLIFIVGFFFCLVSFNYFSANIISSLQQIKGFNTLDEVVSVPEMTLSIPTFANWRNVLHSSPRTEAAKMVQRLDNNENVEDIVAEDSYLIQKLISIEQGNNWNTIIGPDNWLFKVLNDKHSPFNRNQLCKFHYFHIPGADTQMAVWARKDLPYQISERLRQSMIFLVETGIIGVLDRKYKPRPSDCVDLRKSEFKPISYQYVMLPFYILLAGYLASIAIFGTEVFQIY